MPTVAVNGTELYYERHGSGPSLVLVHGDGRDRRAWMPQVEAFGDEYELVIYDLNGYGRSGGSDREEQSFEVHAEDLRARIETLDLDEPTVVGWSMGGRVAYTLAARDPETVSSLVLLEPAINCWPEPSTAGKALMRVASPVAETVGWPRLMRFRRWVSDLRGESTPHAGVSVNGTGMTKSEYVADTEKRIDTAAYNEMIESIRREMERSGGPAIEYSDIDVPTLAIVGAESSDSFEETVDEIVAAAPNAERATIPDAGHAAHIDRTLVFNRLLRGFLDDQR